MSRIAEFKNGKLSYRDMTDKEEAELTKTTKSAPEPKQTAEERLEALEKRITELEKQLNQAKK